MTPPPRALAPGSVFEVERPLRFGHCDPSGIAYFPAYMDMLVGVTEDLFEAIGWPWPLLAREFSIATPTVRLDVTFCRPGFQGERLRFRCGIARLGTRSLDLDHQVSSNAVLWRAKQRLVATSTSTHKSVSWPDPLRQAFASFIEARHA